MKKAYIAGPITGKDPVIARVAFFRMERKLLGGGLQVYNPAALPDGLTWGAYMQTALAVLCSGQIGCLVMLEGWSRSNGARIERLMARGLGIPVFYENDAAKEESREFD